MPCVLCHECEFWNQLDESQAHFDTDLDKDGSPLGDCKHSAFIDLLADDRFDISEVGPEPTTDSEQPVVPINGLAYWDTGRNGVSHFRTAKLFGCVHGVRRAPTEDGEEYLEDEG